jgi:hypothetical protein
VAIGHSRFRPQHRELEVQEASDALAAYERRSRWLARSCAGPRRLVGWRYDGSDDARLRLVSELPALGLRPD